MFRKKNRKARNGPVASPPKHYSAEELAIMGWSSGVPPLSAMRPDSAYIGNLLLGDEISNANLKPTDDK